MGGDERRVAGALAHERLEGEALARAGPLHREPRGFRDGDEVRFVAQEGARRELDRLRLAQEGVEHDAGAARHLRRRALEQERAALELDAAVAERALEARVVRDARAGVGKEGRERARALDTPAERAERGVEALGLRRARRRHGASAAARRSPSASPASRFDVVKSWSGMPARIS